MSNHIEKALLLFERRPEAAAKEVLAAIAENPNDSYLHALLSLCLMNSKDPEGGLTSAKNAIRLDPEHPFAFYALAKCHYDGLNMLEAEVAIDEALRLEPWNANYWGLLSNIQIENGELKEALESAETGLSMEPGDVHCHNLRALIKTRLGSKDEAKESMDTALAADPENALTHAYRGWALIEHHDHAESIKHFREALRIDPTLDWARQGLLKALQVRHWVFQLQLKLGWRGCLAIVAGFAGLLAILHYSFKAPGGLAGEVLQVAKNGCLLGIALFFLMPLVPHTVLLDPFMRFLLLFDRDGRLVMTREERLFSSHLMGFILASGLGIVLGLTVSAWWTLAVLLFAYFITIPFTFAPEKRDKELWITMTACAFLCGGMALLFTLQQSSWNGLRVFLAMSLTKGLVSAGGAKAIIGAIGLGAAATAMKDKEKKKLREQMLSQTSDLPPAAK
ncbi:MAG: tetratricopeptide repeat protein [Candidatus Obscuribacterales bacterium]|nr:tetratricopeptide repeat protein [Candidatus Obscuribacterales bacterium]